MHRLYLKEDIKVGKTASIKGSEAMHIRSVLRLRRGDFLFLFDGSGFEFKGEIAAIDKDHVFVDILEAKKMETESPVEIILGQGIPKSDKMDMIVQKGVELGVSRIVPLHTERVVPKSFSAARLERWRRIAVEACKQSGRVKVPGISEPVEFAEFVKIAEPSSLRLIPWEGEREMSLRDALPASLKGNKIAFIVGPEGGLAESETELAEKSGFIPVSLGKRILRTETVSLTLLSIIQYKYGDLG